MSIPEDLISIDPFIAEGLGQRRGLKMMKERAARADVDAALSILDDVVPDSPPDEDDELSDVGPSPSPRSTPG